MRGLAEKVVVIAGGGSGIGAATARRLASEGARVVVGDLDRKNAEAVADEIEAAGGAARACEFDIARDESVRELAGFAVAEFGGIDGWHNNAADTSPQTITQDRDATTVPLEIWRHSLDVDLTGYLHGIRHAVPELLRRGGGAIVNTSSLSAFLGEPDRVSYATAKSGILALTRHVATRWGKEGVRCNALAVGAILTPAAREAVPAEYIEAIEAQTRSPRLGTPDDVAAMAAFLFSDDAQWLNGQTYHVDGGWHLR
jgi:NAD(P)-dependent dehydrogenase (short-subunit alcohol dehydrogenase family)